MVTVIRAAVMASELGIGTGRKFRSVRFAVVRIPDSIETNYAR